MKKKVLPPDLAATQQNTHHAERSSASRTSDAHTPKEYIYPEDAAVFISAEGEEELSPLFTTQFNKFDRLMPTEPETVTETDEDGNTITRFIFQPFEPSKSDLSESEISAQILEAEAKTEKFNQEPIVTSMQMSDIVVQTTTIDQNRTVGRTPYQEGVTPTGGKSVSIPILTAPAAFAPQIALTYNSQAGNGIAGFGWNIAGVSAINAVSRNIHYDNETAPIDMVNQVSRGAFSLDGVRLVRTDTSPRFPNHHYETAQGFIIVRRRVVSGAAIIEFEALYPDGSRATYRNDNPVATRYTYPIRWMVDKNGNRIDFEYEFSGNMFFVTEIRYGGRTATTHPSKILFTYNNRVDFTPTYIAGTEVRQHRLLTSIVSQNDGQELRTYSLTHQMVSGVNRLTQFGCSTVANSLNPLVFEYPHLFPARLERSDWHLLPLFFNNVNNTIQYGRGKMLSGRFSDGLLAYPIFNRYDVIRTAGNDREFGSRYSPTQSLLVYPDLDSFRDPIIIRAEEGFQLLDTVDVNGDGVDEIVRVNLHGVSGTRTILRITVFTITSATNFTQRSFNVQVEGTVVSGRITSPLNRNFYFGDFRGNGRAQLLSISHNRCLLPGGSLRTSVFELIDLQTGAVTRLDTPFSHGMNEGVYVHTFDADGDGKTELCHASSIGYRVFSLVGNQFVQQSVSPNIPRWSLSRRVLLGDLTGNGKLDVLVAPDNSGGVSGWFTIPVWAPRSCPFCGTEEPMVNSGGILCRNCHFDIVAFFIKEHIHPSCRECFSQLHSCKDPNRLPILGETYQCPQHGQNVTIHLEFYLDNGNTWACHLNTGRGFVTTTQNIVNVETNDRILFIDMNGDGRSDFIRTRAGQMRLHLNLRGIIESFSSLNAVPIDSRSALLPANVVNFFGSSTLINIQGAFANTYGFERDESRDHLLERMTDSYGVRSENWYRNMSERDSVFSGANRTFPFATAVFPLQLLVSETIHDNTHRQLKNNTYTYRGAVTHRQGLGFCGFERVDTRDNLSNMTVEEHRNPQMLGVATRTVSPFATETFTWTENRDTQRRMNPRLTSSQTTDRLTQVVTNHHYSLYDEFNNPGRIDIRFGGNTANEPNRTVINQTFFAPTAARYIIGQPLTKTVTDTREGEQWTNREEITYDTTRRPVSRTTFTGAGATAGHQTGRTQWTYEQNGNIRSELSAPFNVTELLGNRYTYDPTGRYIATVRNALGQTTTFSSYDKYGNARTITDHRQRPTQRVFDEWGQLTSITHLDGTMETVAMAWGGQGVYNVTKTATGQPTATVHYDGADRVMRESNLRFNGSWQHVDYRYDSRGRLHQVSLPFKGASPTDWNTYAYDNFSRPTSLTEASGRVSSWSYNGLTTTETVNGMTTIKTVDITGRLIETTDPGGTIYYTLRPDGQPFSITAPGGVFTTFAYDEFGRQISINDPSAGQQTYSDVYANEGGLTRTVQDARGLTITSIFDRFGRITNVNRPEFNTAYVYNSHGLLTSETSINGTSATFAYDAFDRPATVRENTLDGRFLQKEFSYANGNVETIRYTAQSGVIGTEQYLYANGHHTEIRMNNISFWRLTAENALGQPTGATTGNLLRTYSYTPYGFPTGRMAGAIQNLATHFDVCRGNLESRIDNRHNQTETFGYDVLNRLRTTPESAISYTPNGNITRMSNIGTMEYTNPERPYQITRFNSVTDNVPMCNHQVAYTSFQRPATITENGVTANFDYNASGERVRMRVTQDNTQLLTRHYIGRQYECDEQTNTERLYLGGDAYSTPAVLIREGSGTWTVYHLLRDHLGSITHLINPAILGTVAQELSYDAWGRLRNPSNHALYAPGSEPHLLLGRGFTGHEHLPWFGLINCNARLYDPAVGRFLSPDPFVQDPLFSQSYNRYSYCVNNPLKYVDRDGELWFVPILIGAAIFGGGNLAAQAIAGNVNNFRDGIRAFGQGALVGAALGAVFAAPAILGTLGVTSKFLTGTASVIQTGMKIYGMAQVATATVWGIGAAMSDGWDGLGRAGKLFLGNFNLDENNFWGGVLGGFTRHTWEFLQTFGGHGYSQMRNSVGDVSRVDFFGGATWATRENARRDDGVALGNFVNINIRGEISGSFRDHVLGDDGSLFRHEFGHVLDSRRWGLAYLFAIGIPSAWSAANNDPNHIHSNFWTERSADRLAANYFERLLLPFSTSGRSSSGRRSSGGRVSARGFIP